jgi:hypothetical protein
MLLTRKKRMVEEVNYGDNSTNLKNIDLNKRTIHIHGGMEHNPAKYAKYYSCGNIEISKGNEFTRKINHHRRKISKYW